jgi:hypothetical protein
LLKRLKSPLPPFSRGNRQVSPFQKGDKGGFKNVRKLNVLP